MRSAHFLHLERSRPGRGRGPRRCGRYLPRLAEPEALELFSDRMDHAREYESTVADFALLHDRALSEDVYSS